MYHANDVQSFGGRLLHLLFSALGDETAANGTPMAAAAADALLVDLRRAGGGRDAAAALLACDPATLRGLASDLDFILDFGGDLVLPLGSRVMGLDPAAVRIGPETWVLKAGEPGLFPLETVPDDVGGANLELLRDRFALHSRRFRRWPVGLPSGLALSGPRSGWIVHLPAFAGAGGAILYRSGECGIRFRSALPVEIDGLAKSLVDDLRQLLRRRRGIGARASRLHGAASDAVKRIEGAGVHAVAVSFEAPWRDDLPRFDVIYDGLDDALRPGLVLHAASGGEGERGLSRSGPAKLRRRRRELRRLHAMGAGGRVSDLARSVLEGLPDLAGTMLEDLSRRPEARAVMPCLETPLHLRLHWRDGKVHGDVAMPGVIETSDDCIFLQGVSLPQSVLAQMPGERLDRVVQLPFPCDCTIHEVRASGEEVAIWLAGGSSLINVGTGRIWPEPARRTPR